MFVAGWIAYRFINPWAGSFADIKRVQEKGSRYYRTDVYASKQYRLTQIACSAIMQGPPESALKAISKAQANDPKNPLFDYLNAYVFYKKGDYDKATGLIETGNSRNTLRLFATNELPWHRWQWPEIGLIVALCRDIANNPGSSTRMLIAAVKMGQKVVWCEPCEPVRTMQGLAARQYPTDKLQEIAERQGNTRLATMCSDLTYEAQRFRVAISRKFYRRNVANSDSRTTIIGRALKNNDPKFREAAMLAYMDRMIDRASKVRRECLKKNVLEETDR